MSSWLVRGERIQFPDGLRAGAIRVDRGRIAAIVEHDAGANGAPVLDAGSAIVLPGLVDTHVHINDPGRTEWEGFETATAAAAAGGITTLVDMPLNSLPPTTSVDGLHAKRAAARGRCHVDVAFWGGLVPGNTSALAGLAREGVRGFKCFLSPSGVDEFQNVTEPDLLEAAPELARLGLPLLAHAEWPALLHDPATLGDPRVYDTWLHSRPAASELAAIDLLIHLARRFGVRVHVVHLATPAALPAIRTAKQAGIPITVETCPHYLSFASEAIEDGATAFKCAPPIRETAAREGLWSGLAQGAIDLIATDHSPAPPALKHLADGDFVRAWGGIASLQVALSAVWTGAAARGLEPARLAEWMAEAPARLAGLEDRKGAIAVGRDADLVVFDPDADLVVDARALYHRHPVTPYDGARLRGQVRTTMLRGHIVFDGTVGAARRGELL